MKFDRKPWDLKGNPLNLLRKFFEFGKGDPHDFVGMFLKLKRNPLILKGNLLNLATKIIEFGRNIY